MATKRAALHCVATQDKGEVICCSNIKSRSIASCKHHDEVCIGRGGVFRGGGQQRQQMQEEKEEEPISAG